MSQSAQEVSFEGLYELYAQMVYACAMSILRDHQLAEDAVQETWLRTERTLAGGRPPERPYAWLATVARNEARRIATRRKLRTLPADPPQEPSWEDLGSDETRRTLHRALSRVPEEDRELLTRRFLEGRRPRDLCKVYGLSRAGLWKRISRALESLRCSLRAQNGMGS